MGDISAAKKTKILVAHGKRIREISEDNITFAEEDANGLILPHNDTLVISLNVLDFYIKRVLVDPGSLADIIQWRVLEKVKLTGNIVSAIKLLAGFNLIRVMTRGEILLPTHAEGVTKTTLFEVIDGDIDMTGIPLKVVVHKLSLDPNFPPVRQKKRPISEVRNRFVKEEVTWLLNIGSIREIGKTIEVYIDDMLFKSLNAGDHLEHLQETFDILRKYNMKFNPEKCAFRVGFGKFLGFLVSQRGIKVNPDKIKAIEDIHDQLNKCEESTEVDQ
ncbi:uncharacterized protein LOC142177145 [Nicotiana tabacum]|uniref:Uncharacterized protein LOC142177145 n=1 Tax=Nicotiana tabacum TaxID=4097 RepID=A0AC58TWW4_TOBAC